MNSKIESILALYKAERDMALSAFEIYKYIHYKNGDRNTKYKDIVRILKNGYNGFYSQGSVNYKKRIQEDKLSIKKWKKAKRIVSFMQTIPFISSIAVSGSVSMNKARKDSDIDLFIITKKNRIWTTRTLCMLLTQVIFQRRHGLKTNDKICLNYYMTEKSIPRIRNIASANMFLRMFPIFGSDKYDDFLNYNFFWLKSFIEKPKRDIKLKNFHEIKKSKVLSFIKMVLERLLSKKIGENIEKILSKWQKKRIKNKVQKKIRKNQRLSNLIFSDDILMFHWPKPRNEEVMRKYNLYFKKMI